MLKSVAKVLKEALEWAEGCLCHDELRRQIYSGDFDEGQRGRGMSHLAPVLKDCLRCPMRGRRCPELAAGDFDVFIAKLFEEQASVLLLKVGPRLHDAERTSIMVDFEKARQHLTATFTLKLAHWQEAHFQCFGIAHCDKEKANRCYFRAKRSGAKHPLLEELRSSFLAEDREQYEEARGGLVNQLGAQECSRLRAFLGKLRVSPSAEGPVEGLHAIVNRDIKRCPCHGTALVSLSKRFRQLNDYIASATDNLMKFARLVQQIRHGRDACVQLGLQDHPHSAHKKLDGRDAAHFNVVYHADPYSKYIVAAPDIFVPP